MQDTEPGCTDLRDLTDRERDVLARHGGGPKTPKGIATQGRLVHPSSSSGGIGDSERSPRVCLEVGLDALGGRIGGNWASNGTGLKDKKHEEGDCWLHGSELTAYSHLSWCGA